VKYSYIAPRKKSFFTSEFKLVYTFFSITLFMLFVTYALLLFKDYTFINRVNTIKEKKSQIVSKLATMKEEISFIKKEDMLSQNVRTKNAVLKDSITNLFDLVPERITLSRAVLEENALILYGITPNKDVYNFMLQAPLRSIFHRTYSSFYALDNGWLRFVSSNYTDKITDADKEINSEN